MLTTTSICECACEPLKGFTKHVCVQYENFLLQWKLNFAFHFGMFLHINKEKTFQCISMKGNMENNPEIPYMQV